MKNTLEKFRNIKVKKISDGEEVRNSFLNNIDQFPLVVEPVNSGFNLENWIIDNKNLFTSNLKKYGAILLRGFNVNSVEKFQNLMSKFPNELLEYKMRSSPRFEIDNNVYVSTTYPNDQIINMHSESSYAPNHPKRIVFCCVQPAIKKGETPIADNRKIVTFLSESLKNKFLEKGVLYRRNLNGLLGLSWQEVFQTKDRKVVEDECKKSGMLFDWQDEDTLILKWTKKAIWEHPETKEMVWFNHSLFFNKHMLNDDILKSVESDNDLPNNTFFGDGTEISKEEISEIKHAYEKSTIQFPWQKGDVLFLDNMLMSHGRNSYEGDRKIIVSIS